MTTEQRPIIPFKGPSNQSPGRKRIRKWPDGQRKCAAHLCYLPARLPKKLCAKHRRRLVLGHFCYNDNLWALRRYIMEVHEWSRTKYGPVKIWLLKCCERGCQKLYKYQHEHGTQRRYCSKHRRLNFRFREFEAIFNAARKKSISRNIEWALSYEEFANICRTQTRCVYCRTRVERTKRFYTRRRDNWAIYLDRADNKKGYHLRNVVTCCFLCNKTKHASLTPQEMMIVGRFRARRWKDVKTLVTSTSAPEGWLASSWSMTRKEMEKRLKKYQNFQKKKLYDLCAKMRQLKIIRWQEKMERRKQIIKAGGRKRTSQLVQDF